jgi:hypothetical protein
MNGWGVFRSFLRALRCALIFLIFIIFNKFFRLTGAFIPLLRVRLAFRLLMLLSLCIFCSALNGAFRSLTPAFLFVIPSEERSDNGVAGPEGERRSRESSWDPALDFRFVAFTRL